MRRERDAIRGSLPNADPPGPTASSNPPSAAAGARRTETLAVLGTTTALGTAGLATHEMWRDEAFTWLLIRASPSLAALLDHLELQFVGHPKLYYVLAWALGTAFGSMWAVRIANLAAALAAIAIVTLAAPLTRAQRLAFAVGLFPLYQYGVIARNYALLVLLLVGYCALRTWRPGRVGSRMVLLALMPQVHLFGAFAACVLAVLEVAEGSRRWRWLGTVAASVALCAWQMLPPPELVAIRVRARALHVGHTIADGFLPAFDGFPPLAVQIPGGLALWALSWTALAHHRRALAVYGALTLALLALFGQAYPGFRWHHGFFYIFFLIALWLAGGTRPGGLRQSFVTALFVVHAGMGLYALGVEVLRPYSNGRRAVQALRAQGLQALPLVGVDTAPHAPPCRFVWAIGPIQPILAEGPPRGAWDPRARRMEPFWKHYLQPSYFTPASPSELLEELSSAAGILGPQVVVAVVGPPEQHRSCAFPAAFETVAVLGDATDVGEAYTLYRVRLPTRGRHG